MKLFSKNTFLTLSIALASIVTASAKVTLPSFFTDNMVLQQKSSVPFWGESTANTTVTVTSSWDKKSYTAKADASGKWTVTLATPAYGGPFTITIDDGDKLTLNNILIGEVWLCSGQSNMEMPLDGWGKINNYQQEINNADYPQIRLLQAEHVDSAEPLKDLKVQHGGWQVCSPKTISDFSSTAYFFAKKVYEEKHIPIGLLHSSWGGTFIEAWISGNALRQIHDFDNDLKALVSESDREAMKLKYETDVRVWNTAMEKAEKGNTGKWEAKDLNTSGWKTMKLPQFWESDVLTGFDGVAWFRKEVNLPKNMQGKEITLTFFADDNDKVWINGIAVGNTNGYNVQRNYKIPASIWKESGNVIVIKVTDDTGGGGIYGAESDLVLKTADASLPLAGEWKYAIGVDYRELPARPFLPQGQNRPTSLYNAMISPLIKLPIAGVIWYQGESNADRAHQYQTLFPLLIADWRNKFKNKDLPFYYVQLANYMKRNPEPGASAWAELREAQLKTLKLPNTGMIVATDIGEAEDIHPKNKQEIGYRLARIALAKTYGVAIDYSGPQYKSFTKKGNTITLTFDYYEGLKASAGSLKGFSIAGSDKVFHWAEAKVKGNTIEVSAKGIKDPVAVRYNWADNPDGNLTNTSGLPASSFRTDEWEGITFGKK
ncbi:sialate O-acetylesterase [Flavobacterium sp. DG1-102-2]|uniref:sialate O-acetylesterase n=1 Tax=Flavobacterium sp. DG1-102-2 TaxID=3081663 RepID=UPI002949604C|nr:sialate O-acetylesterase [Flavobacterium sp. DG1-102-2]MDV6166870.1 sialate O-acetylesterase [Flavobacterium sp. DG1-102-2]